MLTRYNAQKIVDKTLKIFGSNINIIDCNGIILASGDPARVNTFHEGAFIAVKENRVVEIDERESSKFKGAIVINTKIPTKGNWLYKPLKMILKNI